jgi:hypothetical protein
VNADLSQIVEWAHKNGLKLNPKKIQVLLIHRLAGKRPQPQLSINLKLKEVQKVVDLGFVLKARLTPVDNISKVCQKLYWVLRSIKPHASYTPITVRSKLPTICPWA